MRRERCRGGRIRTTPGRIAVRADAFTRITGSVVAGEVNTVTGTVTDIRFRGCRFELTLRTEPGDTELLVSDASPASEGDTLSYSIDTAAVMRLE